MDKIKLTVELPLFPGFYESILENSDTETWAWQDFVSGEEPEPNPDDYEYDWQERHRDIAEAFIEAVRQNTPKGLFDDIGFDAITSPREYNFSTDKIWVEVTLSPYFASNVTEFMLRERDWLEKQIRHDWTSRDGFISRMEPNLYEWPEKLLANNDEDDLCRYVSQIWEYIIIAEHGHDEYRALETLEIFAMDDIYDCTYWLTKAEFNEKYPPKPNEL